MEILKLVSAAYPISNSSSRRNNNSFIKGATLEKVVVHLNKNVRRAMLYVACSRATSASGLFIVHRDQETFKPPVPPLNSNHVVKEMQRLLSSRRLVPIYI